MDLQKPIAEQIPEVKLDTQALQETATAGLNSVADAAASVRESVTNTINEFSSKSAADAGQEFLNSNSIIAKFAFLILVLIAFMFILNLGIVLIGYFTQPSKNPYLVNGMINGSNTLVISQDPKNSNAATVMRSNNEQTGIEATWSVWLLISSGNPNNSDSDKYSQHIFNKGDSPTKNNSGISPVANGPGLYLRPRDTNDPTYKLENTLMFVMDTIETPIQIDISGIPMNKWVNVMMRIENLILDVYVNGTIVSRTQMPAVPKQNYYDVNVCANGGFSGNLSDLICYNYALSSFDINTVVMRGPNTSTASNSTKDGGTATAPYYLANSWYTSRM
jgi:hypothetical protein